MDLSGQEGGIDRLPAADRRWEPAGDGCRIAVIGSGFSGTMVAIHLLRRCRPGERVYLVEKSGRFAEGVAYATTSPRHLLNVRVERMSAFADDPDHFVRWLERQPEAERGSVTEAGTFARRQLYGRYLQELLADATARFDGGHVLRRVADTATVLRPAAQGWRLETACGLHRRVDAAVLAVGNFPPAPSMGEGHHGDPWGPATIKGLFPDRPVLLIGTGLTMADICLELLASGFKGPIYALSRRGLLPRTQERPETWDDLRLSADDRGSLLALTRAIRREVRRAAAVGVGWQGVVDSLRPQLCTLWQGLSSDDRYRFLRHLRTWWDVHRHRASPPVATALRDAQACGALQVLAGRIQGMRREADGSWQVNWRPRGGEVRATLRVQRIIDCSGPCTDYARMEAPLLRQLLADGLVRPDRWRLGLDCTTEGALRQASGAASGQLFAVGPVTRGTFWEITAVPDIRGQAEQVAASVLAAARAAHETARARLVADGKGRQYRAFA